MPGPVHSLLLPVRNEVRRVGEVARALAAEVSALPDPSAWEVIFADDASDDGTREALTALCRDLGFRLLAPERNLGRGAVRNLLAREARGEILVFLDGDCAPLPGYLRAWEGLDPREAHLGRVRYERLPPSGFSRFLAEGLGAAKLARPDRVPPAYFISQNFRIARGMFLESGGFRTDLAGWGGEDTDFGFRLERLGIPLRWNGKAEARHPSVTSVGPYLDRLRAFGAANLPVLVREHPGLSRTFKLRLAAFPWSLVFLNPLAWRLSRALVTGAVGVPWPFAAYRYAIFNAYARGWRERNRDA